MNRLSPLVPIALGCTLVLGAVIANLHQPDPESYIAKKTQFVTRILARLQAP